MARGGILIDLCVLTPDGQLSSLRHGIPRIDRKVQQRAVNQAWIRERGPQISRMFCLDDNCFSQSPLQHLRQLGKHLG